MQGQEVVPGDSSEAPWVEEGATAATGQGVPRVEGLQRTTKEAKLQAGREAGGAETTVAQGGTAAPWGTTAGGRQQDGVHQRLQRAQAGEVRRAGVMHVVQL